MNNERQKGKRPDLADGDEGKRKRVGGRGANGKMQAA